MSRKYLTPLNLVSEASDPGNANIGDVYYNTTLGAVRVYTAAGWVSSTGTQGPTGPTGPTAGLTPSNYVVEAVLTTNQALTSASTDTVIAFTSLADPQSWFNNTTHRFQPNIAGYYYLSINTWWTSLNTTNQSNVQIRKNGNAELILVRTPDASNGYFISGGRAVYLNGSTDYIDCSAWSSVTTQSLQNGNSEGEGTNFSAVLLTTGPGSTGPTGATGATGPTGAAGYALIELDGGSATSVYGGITSINAGTATG